jgi:adenine-specific DNA-methyltransferase
MNATDYHAKFIAYELTRRFPPDSPERLAGAVASAQVDLNPHQVDAALFFLCIALVERRAAR